MERTSALMYFLAFDIVSKGKGQKLVDFDPNRIEGKNNRKSIQLEFTKLVLLNKEISCISQVSRLGKIDHQGTDPEKRISSNFLTVPLKKASEHSTPYTYPRRPATPVMKLGLAATGLKWGIEYHDDWPKNLPRLLSEIRSSSPFTDLAVFILRDTLFESGISECKSAIIQAIDDRFSEELSKFWIEQIEKEKLFAQHLELPSSAVHDAFGKYGYNSEGASKTRFTKEHLNNHIAYLENLLKEHQIDFKPLI